MPEARKKYRVLHINLLRRSERRRLEISMTAVDRNLNVFEQMKGCDSEFCSGLWKSVTHLGQKRKEEL